MATGKTPCGIAIPQTSAPADVSFLRDYLGRAETLGYDSVWVQEQILGDSPMLKPITLLTFAAALTARVRLGTSVILPITRNPIHLAKSLSSLDQLSQGRLILGVGMGGPHVPEQAFGIPKENRSRRFVEVLKVMKALWTEPRASFAGEFWNFENVAMEPKPLQKPLSADLVRRARRGRAQAHGAPWRRMDGRRVVVNDADFIKQSTMLRRLLEASAARPREVSGLEAGLSRSRRRSRASGAAAARMVRRTLQKCRDGAARLDLGRRRRSRRQAERTGAGGRAAFLLNPVFDESEHLERLASEVMPHL